ncbi:MAG: efflux RND transporter permease subunit [Betaproteobacteria bacterium]
MSRFFIHRPVFAGVIAIIIVLAGLVSAKLLAVAQYPEIAPPTVRIDTSYPGASAETLSRTTAGPIEEQLSGVEKLAFFNSTSSSTGQLQLTLTFEPGANVDQAVFNVTNRVNIALPRLPDEVRRNGVIVQKRSFDILLVVSVVSPNKSRDTLFLSNYASINLVDELKRLPGLADVTIFGARDYSMRVWINPEKMARLGVTTAEVAQALRAQNAQYAAGKIGTEPAPPGQNFVYTVTATGRLVDPEEFGEIVIRAGGAGNILKLKDIARLELGALNYDTSNTLDGQPTIGMAAFLQPGANALEAAERIRQKMSELKATFPEGVDYQIPFDTTRFVEASIKEVNKTIFEAALLVLAVVFLFLQTWRATLIPMIAVPVSLIGAFAGLWAVGFSMNTLTLFAMVLAIGIVVDDAIVVLENVERLMREEDMPPFEAALEAMREVSGAVVAIVLVLCAVFVPVAFLGGIAGQLYRQFALTLTFAVVISGFIALTLTPALCAILMRRGHHDSKLFRPFNAAFAWTTARFLDGVSLLLRHPLASLAGFVGIVALCVGLFLRIPGSFVPSEDQGYIFGHVQLPDGATLERTRKMAGELSALAQKHPGVQNVMAINGFDLLGGGNKTNTATMFIPLRHWDVRKDTPAAQVARDLVQQGAALRDGTVLAFNPAAIRGLGTAGGLELYLQSRTDANPQRLFEMTQSFLAQLREHPRLVNVNSFFRPTVPQLRVEIDREKALSLGVPVQDVFEALQSTMASLYVNDFNKFGRTYRVQMQADAPFRAQAEDLGAVYVRSAVTREMIPLKALIRTSNTLGAEQLERFNGYLSARVLASGRPGVSSGDAIKAVEEVAARLPEGYTIAWAGQAFQEKRTGSASAVAFALAIVMVFLILAALYERWLLPFAVVCAVPFAVAGALAFVWMRGLENDIYFQIGLVVLIGLAAKNAILIVEFAQAGFLEGKTAAQAALEAARLRFRPIVMTSLAFVLGVLPLMLSTGAGAAARRSMGTGVVGGMLAATFVATLFIPLFFVLVARRAKPRHSAQTVAAK